MRVDRSACHSQGIAGRILRHLDDIAREKGVSQFEADVLPQNKAMLDWGIRPTSGIAGRLSADSALANHRANG